MGIFKEPNIMSLATIVLNTAMFSRSVTFSSLLKGCLFLNGDMVKANFRLTPTGECESVMEC